MKLGELKFRMERLRTYATWVQAAMILDMWMSARGYPVWVFVVLVVGGVITHFIDKYFVYPGESAAGLRANPEWASLKDKL